MRGIRGTALHTYLTTLKALCHSGFFRCFFRLPRIEVVDSGRCMPIGNISIPESCVRITSQCECACSDVCAPYVKSRLRCSAGNDDGAGVHRLSEAHRFASTDTQPIRNPTKLRSNEKRKKKELIRQIIMRIVSSLSANAL